MLIRSLIALFLLTGFLACKRSGNAGPSTKGVDSIHVQYLLAQPDAFYFNTFVAITVPIFNPAGPTSVQFKFTGDKLTRRYGGFVPIASTTGYSYVYSLDVFDKVEYFKDSIIITQDDQSPDFQMLEARRKLILENGRLKTKIYYNVRGNGVNDTLQISYGANGKVSQTERVTHGTLEVKTFSYSTAGNLEKITGRSYVRSAPNLQTGESLETFEGYDGAANPLKNLWLWDDTFYRTISNNNFTKYTAVVNNGNGTVRSTATRSWTLKYDRGQVLFNQ